MRESQNQTKQYLIILALLVFQWAGIVFAFFSAWCYYFSFNGIDFILIIAGFHIAFQAHQLRLLSVRAPFRELIKAKERQQAAMDEVNSKSRRTRRAIIRNYFNQK